MKKWLDNYNDYNVSAPEGMEGDGYSNVGRNSSPAWGGQFQMGGNLPGAVGNMYARTGSPSKGPRRNQTDVTDASAQNGKEMQYYQNGLDWKPKTISKNGAWLDNYEEAENGTKKEPAALATLRAIKEGKIKKENPYKNIKIKDERNEMVKSADNTKTAAKPKITDLNKLNVRNQTEKEKAAEKAYQDKAIAEQRKATREKANANPLNKGLGFFDSENQTRQNWEDSTAGLESKFRVSDTPNFFDDWINPLNQIGGMAADLGAAPNQIVQQDSMMPLITAIGVPLLTGGLEGLGAKTTKQFVSNLVNPLNIVPGYKSAERAIGQKLGNVRTSIAPELRQGLITAGPSFGSKVKSEIDWGKWNKEIPENPQLMKEYDAIEQTSKANNTWMKNPDGSAFQGTPEQFVQQNSENFKKAFGNTKVRDPKGSIQITNHSTWDKFDEFDLNKFGQTDDGFYGKGAYFHPNTNSPKLYGDIDMNSYVNIENPMPHDNHFFFGREGKGAYWDSAKNEQVIIDDLGSLWKGKYDGYITPHGEYPLNDFNSTEYITNIPSNIKSATGNNGMFDMTNPNIYKAIVPGAIGVGALQQQKDGGIIKDDRGQWDHPGEITEINSNDITMEGVPYDVLGVSDTGDTKLMKPGKNYKFKGKKVTEYPMAKNGVNQQDQKTLQQLDQLTNFTNYNKPTIGGWLNKYN